QANHLESAGTVRQPLQKPPLFKPGNQAMNARFRPEAKRFLHLIERGRDTMRLKMAVDEHQQFVLLARQHRPEPRWLCPERCTCGSGYVEQNKNVVGCSSLVRLRPSSALERKSNRIVEAKDRNDLAGPGRRRVRRANDQASGPRQQGQHGAVLALEGRRHKAVLWIERKLGAQIVLAPIVLRPIPPEPPPAFPPFPAFS